VSKKIIGTRPRYPRKRSSRKLLAPIVRKKIARKLVKTFHKWRISTREKHALLGLRPFEYETLKYGGILPIKRELLLRISELSRINDALHSLLGRDAKNIAHWLHTPNKGVIFNGEKAVIFMSRNLKNLTSTRQYLEYFAHGGW